MSNREYDRYPRFYWTDYDIRRNGREAKIIIHEYTHKLKPYETTLGFLIDAIEEIKKDLQDKKEIENNEEL